MPGPGRRPGRSAAHFGRREMPATGAGPPRGSGSQRSIADLFDEAADAVEVVRRLWDSWEDDAEIRDVATGRFIDRDKLHYIDFEGSYFSVKGPSITPRPPQGQPIIAALGTRAPRPGSATATGGPGRSWPPRSSWWTPGAATRSWPARTPAGSSAGRRAGDVPSPGRVLRHRRAVRLPRSPQGRPVIFQAGDSDEGRDFAAASADAIFARHSTLEAGQAFDTTSGRVAPVRPGPAASC